MAVVNAIRLHYNVLAHVKSKCDYFCESSHHVGFKSWLAHSLYMSECFY